MKKKTYPPGQFSIFACDSCQSLFIPWKDAKPAHQCPGCGTLETVLELVLERQEESKGDGKSGDTFQEKDSSGDPGASKKGKKSILH